MSAEAIQLVIQLSGARGASLIALLMLADESKDRGGYPQAAISMPRWAEKCRCCERALRDTVQKLIDSRQLKVSLPPSGHHETIYQIPLTGRKVSNPLGRKVSATLIREEPLEQASRADQQAVNDPPTGKIIRYPKPAKKRQGAG